jgi:hypothetical protein
VGLDEEHSFKKVGMRHEFFAFWMLLPAQRNVKINSDEHHAIFAQDL